MDLAILVGGFGTRLGNLTKKVPKPFLKITKISFIEHLILNYSKYNLKKIYLLCGFKGNLLKKKFHKKFINGVEIICLIEKRPLGTGGALSLLKNKIKKNFFLMNGDTFIDINLNKFNKVNLKKKTGYIVLTKKNSNPNQKLSITNKNIIFYNKKSNYISAGLYFFNKKILNKTESKKISLENEILPDLIYQKKIFGFKSSNYFIDIGTPKDLNKIKNDFNLKNSCLLIDRDGVINQDKGYTYKIKDLRLNNNIIKLLKKFKNKKILIVTNQSGLARGYYKESEMHNFHRFLKERLSKSDIYINDIEFCPHHVNGIIKKLSSNCNCRKPKTGMFFKLNQKWNINKNKSLMIGDKISDQKFANNCKIKFFFFKKHLYKNF